MAECTCRPGISERAVSEKCPDLAPARHWSRYSGTWVDAHESLARRYEGTCGSGTTWGCADTAVCLHGGLGARTHTGAPHTQTGGTHSIGHGDTPTCTQAPGLRGQREPLGPRGGGHRQLTLAHRATQ